MIKELWKNAEEELDIICMELENHAIAKMTSLQRLIEKNKPMKVKHNDSSIVYSKGTGDCPFCGKSVDKDDIEGEWNYCPYCGQKLDWSDENGK